MALAFVACTGIKPLSHVKTLSLPPEVPLVEIQTRTISPGELRYERHKSMAGAKEFDRVELKCRDKVLPFFDDGLNLIFFIRESYFSDMTPYQCNFHFYKGDREYELPFLAVNIAAREFPSEVLSVDSKKVFLSEPDQLRVNEEQSMLNEIYKATRLYPIFTGHFQFPMKKPISSKYGTRRVYNKTKLGQHLGTDFKAWVGSPVKASNTGVVVLARDLFYTGHTVILDHGLGLFTVYGHLDKMYVSEGDKIVKGDSVGLSGRSGRVTGPHLHWGVKVNGEWVDGEQLVALPIMTSEFAQNGSEPYNSF